MENKIENKVEKSYEEKFLNSFEIVRDAEKETARLEWNYNIYSYVDNITVTGKEVNEFAINLAKEKEQYQIRKLLHHKEAEIQSSSLLLFP